MNLQTITLGPYLPPPVTTATFPARASERKGDDDAVGARAMVKFLGIMHGAWGMVETTHFMYFTDSGGQTNFVK